MLDTIANLWRLKHLRNRILFTLFVIAVYRIGTYIQVPGLNLAALNSNQTNQFFNFLDIFSGGAFYRFSIFAMSVTPYITASIIIQLLQSGVVPRFEEWQNEGEAGRQRLTQMTRYVTVGMGLVQASALTFMFARSNYLLWHGWWSYIVIVTALTAGDCMLMWFGEMITEKGIGNGISIIIFVSIISRFGQIGQEIYQSWFSSHPGHLLTGLLRVALLLVGVVAIFALIVWVQQAERRIPIQYAKRVVGRTVYSGQQTHIPLKVNAAGVIPVIFAASLLILPYTIASYFQTHAWAIFVQRWLNPNSWVYLAAEVLLIILFTFFYTHVQVNPQQIAEQLQKNAGYIPGIRSGHDTEQYIVRVLNRITVFGSIFLGAISVLPFLALSGMSLTAVYLGGTSLLIIVGVALQTMQQLQGQLLQRNYRGFIR